jgi:hypothetical protein
MTASFEDLLLPLQEAEIEAVLEGLGCDLIVLARYMQIFSAGFCARHAAHTINIHHSFLPAFEGARAALPPAPAVHDSRESMALLEPASYASCLAQAWHEPGQCQCLLHSASLQISVCLPFWAQHLAPALHK